MAKIKSGAAWALATVEEFPGIRNDPDSPSRGATEIVNFRIREDGSLEKRSGWRLHRRFPATIRALWKGSLDNTSVVFAVAASSVYRWDESSQDLTLVRTIGTSSGNATFIPYMDTLLLIDGNAIYRYSKSQESFIKAFGYVPLVGKDWHPVSGGEWAEARNLLTNYYRITYQNPGGYADYYLPYPASLIRVWVNGVEVFTHSFTSGDRRFSLSTSIVGEVSVLALATDDSMAARIHTASRGILFEDGKHDALLLGGGGCGYHVFASSPVSEASYAEACAKLEESDRLYFPTESLLFLGDAEHPVTAFCKYHGRVIAFNSETAWSIGYGSDTSYLPNVLPIHNAVGCDENGTVTAVDDAILLSNRNGIWSVRASVAYPEEWTVREHSGPIRRSDLRFLAESNALSGFPSIVNTGSETLAKRKDGCGSIRSTGRNGIRLTTSTHCSSFVTTESSHSFPTAISACWRRTCAQTTRPSPSRPTTRADIFRSRVPQRPSASCVRFSRLAKAQA